MLNLVCYVSLCEGLRAGAGSLSYIVHVDCCDLSTIVIKNVIIYVAAKATYIRLLHGKMGFFGGFFGPSSVHRGRTQIVFG